MTPYRDERILHGLFRGFEIVEHAACHGEGDGAMPGVEPCERITLTKRHPLHEREIRLAQVVDLVMLERTAHVQRERRTTETRCRSSR